MPARATKKPSTNLGLVKAAWPLEVSDYLSEFNMGN